MKQASTEESDWSIKRIIKQRCDSKHRQAKNLRRSKSDTIKNIDKRKRQARQAHRQTKRKVYQLSLNYLYLWSWLKVTNSSILSFIAIRSIKKDLATLISTLSRIQNGDSKSKSYSHSNRRFSYISLNQTQAKTRSSSKSMPVVIQTQAKEPHASSNLKIKARLSQTEISILISIFGQEKLQAHSCQTQAKGDSKFDLSKQRRHSSSTTISQKVDASILFISITQKTETFEQRRLKSKPYSFHIRSLSIRGGRNNQEAGVKSSKTDNHLI